MGKGLIICLISIIGCAVGLNAQEALPQDSSIIINNQAGIIDTATPQDSVSPLIDDEQIYLVDSVVVINTETGFKPDSKKAVIYSAIFPGLGQVYNRKYWKLPIIIGGAAGITYAITWNGRVYNDYNEAFRDLALGTGESYLNFVSRDNLEADPQRYLELFERRKNFYRRNRDLAIIVAVGVYALCMLDAYVDAELYDFNMSPDLSMKITPMVMGPTAMSSTTFGLHCVITF